MTCLLWRQAHQLEDCPGVMPALLQARLNRHLALNMDAPEKEEEDELLALLAGPCDPSRPTRPLLSSSGWKNPLVHAALPQLNCLPRTSTPAIDSHDNSRQVGCTSKYIPGDSSATCASGTADISVIRHPRRPRLLRCLRGPSRLGTPVLFPQHLQDRRFWFHVGQALQAVQRSRLHWMCDCWAGDSGKRYRCDFDASASAIQEAAHMSSPPVPTMAGHSWE